MAINNMIEFPDLTEQLKDTIKTAVNNAVKKAEGEMKETTIDIGGIQVVGDLDYQKLIKNLEKQKTTLINRSKNIKKELDGIFNYTPSTKRGSALTDNENTEIKTYINSLDKLDAAQKRQMKSDLERQYKLVHMKESLAESINKIKNADKNSLSTHQIEQYYKDIVKLNAVMTELKELQHKTGKTGNLNLGFNLNDLMKNVVNNKEGFKGLLMQAFDNEIAGVESKMKEATTSMQKTLTNSLFAKNPFSEATKALDDATAKIEVANDKIKQHTEQMLSDLSIAWDNYNVAMDSDNISDDEFDKIEKKFTTLFATLNKYKDAFGINLSSITGYEDMQYWAEDMNSNAEKVYNSIQKNGDKIIEENLKIIESNKKVQKENQDYITSLEWAKDPKMAMILGDDMFASLTEELEKLRVENEKLKASFDESLVDTDAFKQLQTQLERSNKVIDELKANIANLKTELSELRNKEVSAVGDTASVVTGTVSGNGSGNISGDQILSGGSDEIKELKADITATQSRIEEINTEISTLKSQMEGIGSGEKFEELEKKVNDLVASLDQSNQKLTELQEKLSNTTGGNNEQFVEIENAIASIMKSITELNELLSQRGTKELFTQEDVERLSSIANNLYDVAHYLNSADFNKFKVVLDPEQENVLNTITTNFKNSIEALVKITNEELEKIKFNPDINQSEFVAQVKAVTTELNKEPIKIAIDNVQLLNTVNQLKTSLNSIADNNIIKNWKNNFISAIDMIVAKIDNSFANLGKSSAGMMIERWQNEQEILNGTRESYSKLPNGKIIQSGKGSLERKAFMNTNTGYVSPDAYDQIDEVSYEISKKIFEKATQDVNAMLHSHPSGAAVFSPSDIQAMSGWISKGITESYVVGAKKVAKIDLSGINASKIKEIYEEYSKAFDSDEHKTIRQSYKNGDISLDDYIGYGKGLLQGSINKVVGENIGKSRVSILEASDFNTQMKSLENLQEETRQTTTLVTALKEAFASISGDGINIGVSETSLDTIITKLNEIVTTIKNNISDTQLNIEPNIDNPSDFVNKATSQLVGYTTKVDVDPDILAPSVFADEVTRQLNGQKAKIDVDVQRANNQDNSIGYETNTDVGGLNSKLSEVIQSVDAKTNAFREEGQVVSGVIQGEISELTALDGWVTMIREDLEKIKNIRIRFEDIDETQFNDLRQKISNVMSGLADVNIADKIVSLDDSGRVLDFAESIEILDSYIQDLKSHISSGLNVANKILPKDNEAFNSRLNELVVSLKEFKEQLSTLGDGEDFLKSLNNILSKKDELKDLSSILKKSAKQIKEAGDVVKNSDNNVDNNSTKNKNSKSSNVNNNWTISFEDAYDEATKINNALNSTKQKMDALNKPGLNGFGQVFDMESEKVENLNQKLIDGSITFSKYQEQVNKIASGLDNVIDVVDPTNAYEAEDAVRRYIASISEGKGVVKSWNNINGKATAEYIDAAGKLHTLRTSVNQATGAIQVLSDVSKKAETGIGKFISSLKNKFQEVARYFISFGSIYQILGILKRGASTIVQLDTALVDLSKTFKGTDGELNQFYYDANKTAKLMGVTTEEIINQASAWSRLGYSTGEAATQTAELSSQFASISPGMDTDFSTNGLVSIMKAFDIDTNNVERKIMDNINTIGNNFATTNSDVVEGLEKSSAAMNAANNSLEETIALFTAGQEVLQNAETMGQSLKTISMRIRGKLLPPYTVMYMLCFYKNIDDNYISQRLETAET